MYYHSGLGVPGSNGNEGVLYISKISEALVIRMLYTSWDGLTPLQRCSWCILQSKPTGFHWVDEITAQQQCSKKYVLSAKIIQ